MSESDFYSICISLRNWRAERNIDTQSQQRSLLGNLYEELSEYYRARNNNERIDALCDIAVFIINANDLDIYKHYTPDTNKAVNLTWHLHKLKHYIGELIPPNITIHSILALRECFNVINLLGYQPYQCMVETIKEISSRKQHPIQIKLWHKAKNMAKKENITFNEALIKMYYDDRNKAIAIGKYDTDKAYYSTKFAKDKKSSVVKANYDKCKINDKKNYERRDNGNKCQ